MLLSREARAGGHPAFFQPIPDGIERERAADVPESLWMPLLGWLTA
jgi:hypothetical protein